MTLWSGAGALRKAVEERDALRRELGEAAATEGNALAKLEADNVELQLEREARKTREFAALRCRRRVERMSIPNSTEFWTFFETFNV